MRPDHSSGNVVNLDGEELESLLEGEQPAQAAFAETEELDISGEQPVRVTPAPDPVRTGPGRSNPPPSEPQVPVRRGPNASQPLPRAGTEPMQINAPATTGPLRPDPLRDDPTASMRKKEGQRSLDGSWRASAGDRRTPDPATPRSPSLPRFARTPSPSLGSPPDSAGARRSEPSKAQRSEPRSGDRSHEVERPPASGLAGAAGAGSAPASPVSIHPIQPRPRPSSRKPKSKPSDRPDKNIGAVLGSYRILTGIGEGGMGKVYEAEHIKLGRKVALKLLRPEYAVKRDAVARFFKEAQAVNKIRHENIVDITDFVELETGETFIIMELLEGDDLADLTRKAGQPMPLHRAMQIALQVCDALEAAHRVSVIHRDLKPDNIFILNTPTKKDFVKLLDFGVAKLLGESTESDGWQTAAGSVIGTPAYMSPEQASGIPVDARSDIYSLGAILYELFTGHPVFRAKSFGEYVIKHMNDDPVPPRDLADAPKIPAALELVILRCLEKDPNRRYPTVADLREDLARATATVQTMVETVARPARPHGSRARRRAAIAIPIAVVVVALAVGAFWLASGLSIDEVTRQAREPYVPTATAGAGSTQQHEQPTVNSEPLLPSKGAGARIRLETEPPGAQVFRKGDTASLGKTPLDLRLPNIGEEVEFIYRLRGYEEASEKIVVTDNALYSHSLEQKSKSKSGSGAVTAAAKKSAGKVRSLTRKAGKGKSKVSPAVVEEAKPEGKPEAKPKPKKSGKPGKVSPEDQVDPFGQ